MEVIQNADGSIIPSGSVPSDGGDHRQKLSNQDGVGLNDGIKGTKIVSGGRRGGSTLTGRQLTDVQTMGRNMKRERMLPECSASLMRFLNDAATASGIANPDDAMLRMARPAPVEPSNHEFSAQGATSMPNVENLGSGHSQVFSARKPSSRGTIMSVTGNSGSGHITSNISPNVSDVGPTVGQMLIGREDDKIPLFLIKLWNIVEDPSCQNVVCWDDTGYSFHILDPFTFCRKILPQYFKHNNLNSLIRQLNMYGFRKTTPIDRSGLLRPEGDQDHLEFSHPYFVRGNPEFLVNIKRKNSSTRTTDASTITLPVKDLNLLVQEIRQLRDKQHAMETKMSQIIKENEDVWQRLSHIRDMHVKQQQVVNKLAQFLVALVQPTQKRLSKRNLLAIDEVGGKRTRTSSSQSSTPIQQSGSNLSDVIDHLQREIFETGSVTQAKTFSPKANQGPIIADVTELQDTNSSPGSTLFVANSPIGAGREPAPVSQEDLEKAEELSPTLTLTPSLDYQITEELSDYLSGQEQLIDNCRDLLGSCWDSVPMDFDEGDDSTSVGNLRQLMLEGGEPLLALDDAPKTPELLTPITSPAPQDHARQ